MSGYTGHRPGAREVVSKQSSGGLPFKMPADRLPGQGQQLSNRSTTSWVSYLRSSNNERVEQEAPSVSDEYKATIGGVKVGYSGTVPGSKNHFGSSHRGGADGANGPAAPSRGSEWGRRTARGTVQAGVLPIPSMTASDPHPAGYRPPPPRAFNPSFTRNPNELPLSYAGFRPSCYNSEPLFEPVGAVRTGASPAPAQQDSAWHNDWRVHQPDPPPPMPGGNAEQYRSQVGGMLAGYAGYVPGNETHCASSHIGGISTLAQRGHNLTKSALLREQADKWHSRAATSVIGYSGLRPKANNGLGMSYWASERRNATPPDLELYSA